MRREPIVALVMIALAGCDSPPANERLEMNISKIRALCAEAGLKAWAASPLEDGLRKQMFIDGVKAECELEYRIKQQQVNKIF
jgi:hypothetical protein